MTEYRWAPASGGAIPSDACENGHGWEWGSGATEDDDLVRVPLWVARTRADAGGPFAGSVRPGYVRRGAPARIGGPWDGQSVNDYKVLLDSGTWSDCEVRETEDASHLVIAVAGTVVCGHAANGGSLRHVVVLRR